MQVYLYLNRGCLTPLPKQIHRIAEYRNTEMENPDRLAERLIACVVRAFYTDLYVVVVDALVRYDACTAYASLSNTFFTS